MNVLVAIHSPVAAWNIPPLFVDRLRRDFPHHDFVYAAAPEDVLPLIGAADTVFMGEITRQQLAAAVRLRWIHSAAAGIGGMLFREMLDSPVVITNSRGMSADVIAEHVLALVLAVFRKLPDAVRAQAEGRWAQDDMFRPPPTRTLAGARVLIVGLGGIGSAAARRFAAMGARVTGTRRDPSRPMPEGVAEVADPSRLGALLPDADVVVLAAPHTAASRHMIGAPELAAMKGDAVLVNVSRGKLVDEAALAEALQAGRIGAAALDVFDREPLPATSPFWSLPNVIITPHTSGFRPDHWDAAVALFSENLRRHDEGRPLLNVVNKEAGY